MLTTIVTDIKYTTLTKRSRRALRRGNSVKSNYLMIRAIDLHVPQLKLNA